MGKAQITQSRLKELLHYDPDTGVFTRKIGRRGGDGIGSVSGYLSKNGYIQVCIDYRKYQAHRLAFMYMTGKFPRDQVDHIDMNKSNNVWSNLRECNSSQNQMNTTRCKSVFPGVGFRKDSGFWRVRIMVDKKEIPIGQAADLLEAVCMSINARRKYHGEFSAV